MDGILPARTNSGIAPYKKNISLVAWMSVKKPVAAISHIKTRELIAIRQF
jgi:hypothetical protein